MLAVRVGVDGVGAVINLFRGGDVSVARFPPFCPPKSKPTIYAFFRSPPPPFYTICKIPPLFFPPHRLCGRAPNFFFSYR